MLKVLFIENEPDAVTPVVNLLKREQTDVLCKVSDFPNAESTCTSFRPHIVILDLLTKEASVEPQPEGLTMRDFIWEWHFCPIVIYSARPEFHDEKHEAHPFVKSIQKGKNSARAVMNAINELRPHVEALTEAEEHVRRSFSSALRDIAPYAFETFTDSTQRVEAIKRSGRRRLAALMDDGLTQDGTKLACWEQYLYPPLSKDIKLADILMEAGKEQNDPTAFRLVLTPSCDLVTEGERSPKVSMVLTAKCCSIKDGLDLTNMKGMSKVKLKDRLPGAVLSHGYLEPIIPFPCLKGRIPTMAANLRDLDFIPIDDIGKIGESETPFLRIASIDSPFRELISWAFLQIACRPGIPDRDFDAWRDEIILNLENTGGQGTV